MGPLTSVVMAVLCAHCTLKAQKPGNANTGGGGTNAPQMTATQQNVGSAAPSSANGDAGQQAAPQSSLLNAPAGPSRIVFQSTPAYDTRTTTAFGTEPGWGVPAAVPVTPKLNAVSFGGGTNTPSPVCFAGTETVTVQTLILATRGHPATPEQRQAAISAGLHYGLVWGSVFILK